MISDQLLHEYESLTRQAGVIATPRTEIELQGDDRATFLHNLCTNEIRKLPTGSGCEAFFTNVQGKVLFHAFVWAAADSLMIESVGGAGDRLFAHLDRYLIREKVSLLDRTAEYAHLLLSGAGAVAMLKHLSCGLQPASGGMAHAPCTVAGSDVSVRQVPITQPHCYVLRCDARRVDDVRAEVQAAGAVACSPAALEMARIEAGFPWYGIDISDENLAPEIGRDRQAISYVKGCYLGQETIARIDALGHVNRTLVGMKFDGNEIPSAGTELTDGDKVVGKVTSAAYSPRLQAPLALAYVRRGHNEPGARLQSCAGSGVIVQLPV